MQPERELDGNAEVAAAAPEGPEQIGVLFLGRVDDRAVGLHDPRPDEVVEGESVRTHQVSDAASEREPRNAGITERAARCREPVPLARRIEVLPERAAAAGRRPALWIDGHPAHQPQVDDDAPVTDAVT